MSFTHSACFLLKPEGALRFGGHPEDLTATRPFPEADTVFGALASAIAQTRGESAATEWVGPFAHGSPPFLLSSLLPYHPATKTAFVPRPHRRPPEADAAAEEADPKRLKAVRYVDAALTPWHAGRASAIEPQPPSHALLWRRGVPRPDGPLWSTDARPGVAVDRVTSASQVFGTRPVSYACELAIYVLARRGDALDALLPLFEVLSELGIGGGRSRGLGRFSVKREDSPLPLSERPVGLALSPVWPRPDELRQGLLNPPDGTGYRIVERTTWIASPQWNGERARTVSLLEGGSYVSAGLEPPVGGLADVTPADRGKRHSVYRYGYGLFLDEAKL